jgi:hypothetical protein
MTGTQPPPRRVAVTAPRRNRSGGWSARARAQDLHAQPRLGQIYLRALVRDQLRLALGVLAVLTVVLGGLPAAFALLPGLRTVEVAGIRLPWLLLGAVAYPVMVGVAWFHVRHAERVERDFTDMLNAPDPAPDSPPNHAPTSGSAPAPDSGPDTGAESGAGVVADRGVHAGVDYGPGTAAGPGVHAGAAAGPGHGADPGEEPGSGTGPGPGAGPGGEPGLGTGAGSRAGTGSGPEAGSRAEPGAGPGAR